MVVEEVGRDFSFPFERGALRMRAIQSRMGRVLAAWIAVCSIASLTGCGSKREAQYFVHAAMGVKVELRIDDPDLERARTAAIAAFARIDALDAAWSDWKIDSEISRFNHAAKTGAVEVSVETSAALAIAVEVAYATDGRFDPTIGPLVTLWRKSRNSHVLPHEAELARARAEVGVQRIEVNGVGSVSKLASEVVIDFGGIGKGLAAAELVAVLAREGCPRCLVAVAGDIAAGEAPHGSGAWRVDIEWKDGRREEIKLLRQSASTSGDAEQFVEIDGKRYAHIIDPATGLGALDLEQVTVIGARVSSEELATASITDPHSFISNGGRVDAYATALTLARGDSVDLPTGFRVIREGARN